MTEYCTDRETIAKLHEAIFKDGIKSSREKYIALDIYDTNKESSRLIIKHMEMLNRYDILGNSTNENVPIPKNNNEDPAVELKVPYRRLTNFEMTDAGRHFELPEMLESFIDYIVFREENRREADEFKREWESAPLFKNTKTTFIYTLIATGMGALLSLIGTHVLMPEDSPNIHIVPVPIGLTLEQFSTFQSCMQTTAEMDECLDTVKFQPVVDTTSENTEEKSAPAMNSKANSNTPDETLPTEK